MMLASNARLTAVMEVNPDDAERLRVKYDALRAYTADVELINDPDVDAVYIASPVTHHARQAKLAADAGKHILLEKPLALSAEEAQEVVDYCKARDVLIAAGFMMRYGSYVQVMKQAIGCGQVGDVVCAHTMFSCWYPEITGAWRQKKQTGGGGALMDMGIHCIDLISYIIGSRIKQVCAINATQTFSYDVEDASAVLLRLENGTICSVQSHFNIPDEAADWRLEFFGTKGRLSGSGVIGQMDGGKLDAVYTGGTSSYDARQEGSRAQTQCFTVEFGNLYTREIESFGMSVLNGAALEVPAQAAVDAQRVVEAAYLSGETGKVIEL